MRYEGIVERQWLWFVDHMSACGSKIARKIESTAAPRERMHEGRRELASLAYYYGSQCYRAARGISRSREVGEEFSFGNIDGRSRWKRRKKEKKGRGGNWIPRDISRAEYGNLCFTFNKTKRERRRPIEPLAAVLFYRIYKPSFEIRIIPSEFVPQKI